MIPTQTHLAPAFSLAFRLRGFGGQVHVRYGANHDPWHWGFGAIQLPFDVRQTAGFPVCQALVAYDGTGYRALMGWIQLVTVRDARTEEVSTSLDVFPMLREAGSPFCEFGYAPTFFDAPGPNPPRANETWIAETFLAICPGGARTRQVSALLGFRWGYLLAAGRATPLPAEPGAAAMWDQHLPLLRARYPDWEFAAGFHG